jgi:hypothetical protein
MPCLVEALATQRDCFGDCHRTLSVEQRARAVECIYHLDDALRGWGYVPLYDVDGDRLWREAQHRGDPAYRGVAVRFGACIYRRLVGAMLHEVLHASFGDVSKANYGIPFGLPYGVPEHVPDGEEEEYLAPHNFAEARAFVGVWILASERFGIDWPALNARAWGTYGFTGGNALVSVPRGYRAVAHFDAEHHHGLYIARARALEREAIAWYATGEHLDEVLAGIDAAAARGRATRAAPYPASTMIARQSPAKLGRNDRCPCGSGRKVKVCCRSSSITRP